MLAHSGKSEKLFYVEREIAAYDEVTTIPEEYLPFILPYAGVYFETDDECDIISQHRQVGPFSIWIQEVFAKEEIILCPFTPFPTWALHFMFETSLEVELYKNNSFALSERECNLFNLESDLHRVPMTKGQRLLSCHINIIPEALKELAHEYPSLYQLANKQTAGISGPLNQHPYHINPICSYLLQRILTCRHIEMPADHFLYRCCLNLFLNFAQQDLQLPLQVADVLNADELNMLFKFITENPHQPFSIQQLAELSALNPHVLKEGFARNFYISIEHYVLMVKMIMVFELLTEKDTPLSAIAGAAGFQDWESLNSAFKMYYGCELEELRRAM